jgi:hypothetical protein
MWGVTGAFPQLAAMVVTVIASLPEHEPLFLVEPGHIEDCRKALLNSRTSAAPYQGLDVADQEKQDREPPMRT